MLRPWTLRSGGYLHKDWAYHQYIMDVEGVHKALSLPEQLKQLVGAERAGIILLNSAATMAFVIITPTNTHEGNTN